MMGCWLRLHPRVRVWCPPRASSAPEAETCSRVFLQHETTDKCRRKVPQMEREPQRSGETWAVWPRQPECAQGQREEFSTRVDTGQDPSSQAGTLRLRWRLAAGAPSRGVWRALGALRSLPQASASTAEPPTCGRKQTWSLAVSRDVPLREAAGPSAHPESSSEQGQSLRAWTLGCGVAAGPPSACPPGQSRETPSMRDGERERGGPRRDPRVRTALWRAAC